MIIASQDKSIITDDINIFINKNDIQDEENPYALENEKFVLGRYDTEKRAKEVLQEIIKKYASYLELRGGPAIMQGQMDIQPNIFNIPKVYEMPKE